MRTERAPVTSVTSVTAVSINRSTRARVAVDNAKGRHTRHTRHALSPTVSLARVAPTPTPSVEPMKIPETFEERCSEVER
jgi:hypothetical protein